MFVEGGQDGRTKPEGKEVVQISRDLENIPLCTARSTPT